MRWKNTLIKFFLILCYPLTRPFRNSPPFHRFLIISTTGLGDTLWATPALRALRESRPHAYIGVLTTEVRKEIFDHNPHLDELFSLRRSIFLSLLRLLPLLRKRKIHTILIFHASQRLIFLFASLLGAERIVGSTHGNKELDSLLTDKIEEGEIHEIERRLSLVCHLGCSPNHSKKMELFPSSKDEVKIAGPSQRVIGLHPGAHDRFKQWPSAHFIELGRRLQQITDCQIIVTGNQRERELVTRIASAIPHAIPFCEDPSVLKLASLLKQLSLYITNDTGALHVASAMETPTIALFAPTHSGRCGPYFNPRVKVIQKNPVCFPCLKKQCQEPFCMLQISPLEVFHLGMELLFQENK